MLRLFLSVDIQGSTNQKDKLNYSTLYSDYQEKKNILKHLISEDLIYSKDGLDDDLFIDSLILESMGSSIEERKHLDWLEAQSKLFEDFNSKFIANLARKYNTNLTDSDSEKFLWKAIGDELVYVFEVKYRNEIHDICLAFLSAVYFNDEKLSQTDYYRLKASAWTAGFPIRNREIKFPFPETYSEVSENGNKTYIKYNYPQLDFIGPDIDIGFRIGKFCWPGLLAVSMDLAELLSEYRDSPDKLNVKFVGWQNLKGVWDNIHYPIFWVSLNKDLIKSEDLIEYDFYGASDIPLSKQLEKFHSYKDKDSIDEITSKIQKIRTELPKSLGLVKPYLMDDKDIVPDEHQKISDLLDKIKAFQEKKKSEQEKLNKDIVSTNENFGKVIEDKIENKFDNPSNL